MTGWAKDAVRLAIGLTRAGRGSSRHTCRALVHRSRHASAIALRTAMG